MRVAGSVLAGTIRSRDGECAAGARVPAKPLGRAEKPQHAGIGSGHHQHNTARLTSSDVLAGSFELSV